MNADSKTARQVPSRLSFLVVGVWTHLWGAGPPADRALGRLTPHASLLTVILLLAGCGYHFPGDGAFPSGIRSVHLVAEPADSPLAAALATALRRDSQVSLAETAEGADGILRVSGGKPSSRPAAIDQSGVATEYEVRLGADFRLLQRTPQGEEPVVARKGLEVRTTYPYQEGATSPAVEEANKRRAARQAANDLAERILSAIRQNF